ncbi:FAD-dependent monooxygenase [Micromonospora sp. LH3U1]|uniref:FAD-dependent monooxygenase n=1 Tax=Micromonospora sp. LH3U1 TaxID=3018339 RepID=UPI00234B502B|nr:FAD-dependent monooxygenase [Micromonospora sp. LH3U1]WCN82944.1 FAD-dependent monooxygenase [Micromonospora sp. LH3U1]
MLRRPEQAARNLGWVAPRIDDEPAGWVQLGRGRQFLTIPISAEQTYCYYDDDTLHAGPNQEVVLDSWSRGPVLLIGDAAHATSPNMAQGAAMTLEDAVVLASSLAAAGSVADALRGYVERRRPRTGWVLSQTHRRDKATGLLPTLRDTVIRRLGEQMFPLELRPAVSPALSPLAVPPPNTMIT